MSWIGWFTVAILFMTDPSFSAIPIVGTISLVSSLLLSIRAPLLGLYLLPLPLMIGPVNAFPIQGIGYVTAGDLYSIILIARSLFLHDAEMGKAQKLFLLTGFFMLLIGTALSYDLLGSIVGLTRIIQYALLIRVSIILIKTPAEFRSLFNSWIFITTLCAVMMLWHFYCGRSNMVYWMSDPGFDGSINFGRTDLFFRATFFYANFFIPMGLSIIFSFITLLMRAESNRVTNRLLLLTIPVNVIALIINNTRSMLIPAIFLCGLALIWSIWDSIAHGGKKLQKIISLILISIFSMWILFGYFITDPQSVALSERIITNESVVMRLSVWESALARMIDNPFRLIFGWGPGATQRQIEQSHMKKLLTGTLGNTEGAFDSTIVGFLVEYGFILSSLLFIYILVWFLSMMHYFQVTGNAIALSAIAMAVALIFCHIFQQFTFTPPGLMALQVLAIPPFTEKSTVQN